MAGFAFVPPDATQAFKRPDPTQASPRRMPLPPGESDRDADGNEYIPIVPTPGGASTAVPAFKTPLTPEPTTDTSKLIS